MSSSVTPSTAARAIPTLSRFGLSCRMAVIRVAMSSPSPATRLHNPRCLSAERDDAVPEFPDAIGPHEGFLALHAKRPRDALRRDQLRQAEPDTVACCTEEEEAKEPPFPAVDQATRTEFGRPRSSIRLRTWAAMATSVARASSLWKRSPSPMTCFQRANWPSTRALSL